ncbi:MULTISPECIES: RelA/SpoT family protein [unclassified Streptomyces]|uniref:RelA/SpoT family protein n=1 Tax=unclassified Streptomyces TaxID=2593676 RepID=UPI000DADE802|nr:MULTISPECIES: HD domain-containing protein [unclassified Streptomyces]PZT77095.1 bifunctional (p)ppGpp synthetase/guanosine-3',5'-bis(diphosphate) 3'-pyrophosphohydrolase [Streptomyces sp. AC1-42W]PZT78953.1 bifunctional (p)ppGpp synthetase/guanosine-3',5'-bis(diphosphate) 3'-pyrophosphohydrolase [Streptomyces sp. AC1-42T]
MSAEATSPGTPIRRRSRPRIDLRRIGRAALFGPVSRDGLPDAIAHVAEAHRAHHPDADLAVLHRAYLLAETSHRGQMRKSGEPYITHPLAVTLILAELGAETTTLTASLLHDTVEDTEVTLDQVREQFGEEVCYLVDGVTKLEKVDYGAAAEPETFRKMLVATGDDVRVMSIKLADRLHNMRTLGVMRPEKQARIAKVTRDVLIPLAERLGVQALKTELEDLVFAILHPEEYARTSELITGAAQGPDPLGTMAGRIASVLREAGISADVQVRPRHFVSVHRARIKRGELRGSDFGRVLVLVGEDADCYAVLGELHTCFTPVISEFKDFIAAPKFNLYQSLHTAVVGPDSEVAEILIRTHRMHKVAEAGVVALGNPYAPDPAPQSAEGPRTAETPQPAEPADGERADPTRPGWLSRLLQWQRSAPDPDTFWTTLRADLAQDREITVFRTDGGTLGLPAGASCVDAAYAQHGNAAHACIGARVNGRLATLSTVLKDGDTVQPLIAEDAASGPSPRWLDHARTPAARIAITGWLEAHPQAAEAHPPAAEAHPQAADSRPRGDAGQQTADRDPRPAPPAAPRTARAHTATAVAGRPDAFVRLAGCCTPVPPDEVTGFPVRGGAAVTVHRLECPAVARMNAAGRTPVAVSWGDEQACRVTLVAESFGRPRLLADLTEAIAGADAAVISATVEPPSEQRVRHTYTLRLPDAAGLPALMRAMREVPGVYDVSRAKGLSGTH